MIRLCLAHNKQSIDGNSNNEDAFTTHDATVPLSWICFLSRPQGRFNRLLSQVIPSSITQTNLSQPSPVSAPFWASEIQDWRGRKSQVLGVAVPYSILLRLALHSILGASSKYLHQGAVTSLLICSFHACRQGPGNTGVKDTESLPSGSSCSSEGKRW